MPDDTRRSAEALLADIERRLHAVDVGLLSAEPAMLQVACIDLRRVTLACAGVLEAALSADASDHALRHRVAAVAQRLADQRESLARRSVVVERTLASIMRLPASATYSMPGRRPVFGAPPSGGAAGMH